MSAPGIASDVKAFRGSLLDFTADPRVAGAAAMRYFADGLLLVQDGRVLYAGEAKEKIREFVWPLRAE